MLPEHGVAFAKLATPKLAIKAIVDNRKGILRSGELVTAEIIWKTSRTFLVPTEAVSLLAGQAFVFVAKDDGHGGLTSRQVPVEPGETIGADYRILSGLHAGDKIVLAGIQNLTDGAPIEGKE